MSGTSTFIQYKGTDICMDFHCGDCGADPHFDGYFAHYVKCTGCGTVYELGTTIPARKLAATETPHIKPMEDVTWVDDE